MQCIYNVKKKGDEEEEVEESGEGEVVENREVAGELLCANLELKALPAGSSTSSTCPRTAVCTPSTTDSESESEPGSSPLESSSHGLNPNNAQCVHCSVLFPCSKKSPVANTGEYQITLWLTPCLAGNILLPCSCYRGIFEGKSQI